MDRRKFIETLIYGIVYVAIGGILVLDSEYADLPVFDDIFQAGRTKNAIASVVAGIVGQKLYGDSYIDLKVQKHFFPDARVTGNTSYDSIDTYVKHNLIDTYLNLALKNVHFKAQRNDEGLLEGRVNKSEFDWKVKQISEGTYEIVRWGPKFNARLELGVQDGEIFGTYIRPGPHFDWEIKGTYDENGNVNIKIDGPMNLGIILNGKITPE